MPTILEHGVRGAYVMVRLSEDDMQIQWNGSPVQARNVAAKLIEHAEKAEAVRRNAENSTAAV